MMHKKFQMSSMGELTFFLGLQVKQKEDGIFNSQDKYVNEILNKFGFSDVKTASTPMETHKTLLKDEKGEDVDEHLYRSMIGSLTYLTSSRPDIMFVVDGKKVVLSEASIRRDLRFGDKGGIDCFSNEFIFEQLTLMGAKTTAWNEFSSSIASAVICLATDVTGNQSNGSAGKARVKTVRDKDYILLPLWTLDPLFSSSSKDSPDDGFKLSGKEEKKDVEDLGNENNEDLSTDELRVNQEKDANVNSTNNVNTVSLTVNAASIEDNAVDKNIVYECADDPNIPDLEEIGRTSDAENDDSGADMNNLDTYFQVSPTPTTRIYKDHPLEQVIEDLHSAPQTRRMSKNLEGHGLVFRSKLDERGIVIRNKAMLVAQGHTQEEGIDYDEIFTPVVRIEAIRLFLAYASFKDFVVYQMYVKSAFLYEKIKKEVYVCQPPGFEDPDFPEKVYKVEKALYGLHQAPRAWYEILSTYLLDNEFQRGTIDKTLFIKRDKSMQVKQKEDGIFNSQEKYVIEILNKFGFSDVKTSSTPMEIHKTLFKDEKGEDIDEHLYRSMIASLMYITSLRPDISLQYLKGQPKFGLWYPKDPPFDLEAYTGSDYAGASLYRKSTTGGCQFLWCRLISWKCKKQTVVVNSITKAEYITASNCCGQLKVNEEMFDTGVLTTIPTLIADSTRPKAKGIVMQEPSKATTTTLLIPSHVKDKGKGKLVKPEMPLMKKAQISLDEELAFKLQDEQQQEERIAKEKAQRIKEVNLAWEDVQAKIEAELKRCLEIVADDEDDVTIDATPLSSKSLTIIDYKIHKEGRKSYFQIIMADGSSQMYCTFSKMLKNFNREYLEVLWSIMKARFEKVQPVNLLNNILFQNLKTMFEHHVEDNIWKNQQGLVKMLNWKLFDSCGVYCMTMQNIVYYLLVEKMHPLARNTLHQMWNDVRLKVDYEVEMAYVLLRSVRLQLR
uniref:Reverse transcriptase Ty1/copia-type domain-containing protein n=1 Tax=Tanacetum cinerariifolium TaxID=118510 RepID=A0A699HHA3_TANCI|nr:hypothetical protein [Tanacetum cinerariifolium]